MVRVQRIIEGEHNSQQKTVVTKLCGKKIPGFRIIEKNYYGFLTNLEIDRLFNELNFIIKNILLVKLNSFAPNYLYLNSQDISDYSSL